jgi:hypothetical protein
MFKDQQWITTIDFRFAVSPENWPDDFRRKQVAGPEADPEQPYL